jgi:hypothetical protein
MEFSQKEIDLKSVTGIEARIHLELPFDDGYRDRNILLPHGKMLLERIVDVRVWWIAGIACLRMKGFT